MSTRREFLKTGSMAGLCLIAGRGGVLSWAEMAAAKDFRPNAFIQISPNNEITFWVTRCEMGQGVRTLLPIMLAEELEVDPQRVRLVQPATLPEFKDIRIRTSGSGSASGTWNPLRRAGASAREMLVNAAASQWQVDGNTCRAENGTVVHLPSGRRKTYGDLASAAAALPVPQGLRLRTKDFRLIGGRHKRVDGPPIVTGRAQYGMDVRLPEMHYAVIAKAPTFSGKAIRWKEEAAKRISGVKDVVPVSEGYAFGIAITAEDTWAALKARDLLEIEWQTGEDATFSSDAHYDRLRASLRQDGFVVREEGRAPASARDTFEAQYEWPYQAHAPLEPMNCTAHVRGGRCDIWVPTQAPEEAQLKAAKLLGMPVENVTVHVTLMGGGFGRRLFTDYVQEAVEIAKAVDYPVQLLWTRQDDMRHGHFNPASFSRFVAKLDENKKPVALLHRCASSDLSIYNPKSVANAKSYSEDWSPWGAFDNPYNFGSLKVEYVPVESPVPTGPWRSVEYPGTTFGRECFIDELAHGADVDPIEYRLALLKPATTITIGDLKVDRARLIRVLEAVRERSDWSQPLNASGGWRRGRGVACNVYHGETSIAQVAEVAVGPAGDVKVERLVCVLDLGQPLNLLGIEGQVESAMIWGLSSTLKSSMRFENGSAVSGTYRDYPVIRMHEAPRIDVHVLPSQLPPSGLGEQPVPLVAPAVANAIFAATGKRIRRLPILTVESD